MISLHLHSFGKTLIIFAEVHKFHFDFFAHYHNKGFYLRGQKMCLAVYNNALKMIDFHFFYFLSKALLSFAL